jgi:hypothetical protein
MNYDAEREEKPRSVRVPSSMRACVKTLKPAESYKRMEDIYLTVGVWLLDVGPLRCTNI